MTLRSRLILAAAYLLTVVVIALEVPLAVNIDHARTSDFTSSVLSNAAIISARINDDLAAQEASAGTGVTGATAAMRAAAADGAARLSARVVVADQRGQVVIDTSNEAPPGTAYMTPERPEFAAAVQRGRITTLQRHSDTLGEDLLLVTVPVVHNGLSIGAVRISESLAMIRSRVHRSWLALALIGLAVVLVGLGLAWLLATSLARPVRRLEETAVRLGRGDLGARADPSGPSEVASLARSFNQMAGTISANVTAQRDFVANASHQLRTPLTGLRLRLEAIEHAGGEAGADAAKANVELTRLTRLVNDLLDLARASSVQATSTRLDLKEIAERAVERWSGPAAESEHRLALDASASVWVAADRDDLGHVLDNLIENGIRYTPAGTSITVSVANRSGRPTLAVEDDGPGVPNEEHDRVFERFFRGSSGRRAGPGTGLGLAIVHELVARWGGDAKLRSGPGGRGTIVEASFPAELPASNPELTNP